VIFIGDHGYHHNERNWWNKNTLFERVCRAPCIIVAPGGKHGAVCKSLIEFVDLYPTIADYCGINAAHKLPGQSLRPLLEHPDGKGRDAAFTLVVRGRNYGQSVRTDRWRYTQWSDGNAELYDELNDHEEVHDLAGDPASADTIHDLKEKLKQIDAFVPAVEGQKKKGQRADAGQVLMAGAELSDEPDADEPNNEGTKQQKVEHRRLVVKSLKP
jgi:arylsulfatase A-like enzyme